MIRFQCSHCDKTLKASENKAGASVICPRCEGCCVVPGETLENLEAHGLAASASPEEEDHSLFSGMSMGLRLLLVLVVGVGLLSLLLAVLSGMLSILTPVATAATSGAMVLAPASFIAVLTILYGHWTNCPSCSTWWARREARTEFVNREVFEKGGTPFGRSTYRTTYQCDSCGHNWSVTGTEEYKQFRKSVTSGERGT